MLIERDRAGNVTAVVMRKPDNWHCHPRQGAMMRMLIPVIMQRYRRIVAIGNTKPEWITTAAHAWQWKSEMYEIASGYDPTSTFEVFPAIMITDQTTPKMVEEAIDKGFVNFKIMFRGGSTNSHVEGITDLFALNRVWRMLEKKLPKKNGLVLFHAEVPEGDHRTREGRADPLVKKFAGRYDGLPISIEHISTEAMLGVVVETPNLIGTITPVGTHHVWDDQEKNPHCLCLPRAKTEGDRKAILAMALSAHPKFSLGLDDAPHDRTAKECERDKQAFGAWSTIACMPKLLTQFEQAGQLENIEKFGCENGAKSRGLPLNEEMVRYEKRPSRVPSSVAYDGGEVVPWCGGEEVEYTLVEH